MKKIIYIVIILLLAMPMAIAGGKKSYVIGFYNLENLWEDAPAEDIPDLD